VEKYITSDTFFVTYGDGVGDVNLHKLLEFHCRHGKLATITGVRPYSQYGVLELAEGGRVIAYRQYPRLDHWVNAGFMVFEHEVLDYLTDDNSVDLERGLLTRLAAEGQLMMYKHTGFWQSMDTFKDSLVLSKLWAEGKAQWKVW
jgi:glucose-1-phosphate cytidylyltransferase